MRRITKAKALHDFRVELTFDDRTSGTVDLSDLAGKGVFALWLDPSAFAQVRIGSSGELAWGDQVDLCPDELYLRVTGKTMVVQDVVRILGGEEAVHPVS